MKRYKVIYVVALAGSMLVYFLTNHWSMLILAAMLIIALVVANVFLFIGSTGVSLAYNVTDTCIVNQQIPVTIQLNIARGVPLGKIVVRLKYKNLIFQECRRQEITLEQGRERENSYELPFTATDCGKVRITVERARCYDMLGVFYRNINIPEDEEIVIYPIIPDVNVQMSQLPDTVNNGLHYDNHRKGQDVTEVFDLRDYVEGDSIKSIHWKLSSKLDRMVVREFGHPSNYQTVIYYDASIVKDADHANHHDICNGVLGIAAAISKGLMEQYHQHRVVTMNNGVLSDDDIQNMHDFANMLDNEMSRPVSYDGETELLQLVSMELYTQFSKMILVTGKMNETLIHQIAENVNLTAIIITESGEQGIEQGINYTIVTIPVKDIEDKVRAIEI